MHSPWEEHVAPRAQLPQRSTSCAQEGPKLLRCRQTTLYQNLRVYQIRWIWAGVIAGQWNLSLQTHFLSKLFPSHCVVRNTLSTGAATATALSMPFAAQRNKFQGNYPWSHLHSVTQNTAGICIISLLTARQTHARSIKLATSPNLSVLTAPQLCCSTIFLSTLLSFLPCLYTSWTLMWEVLFSRNKLT